MESRENESIKPDYVQNNAVRTARLAERTKSEIERDTRPVWSFGQYALGIIGLASQTVNSSQTSLYK